MAVLGLVVAGATSTAANTYVIVDWPKANSTVPSSFVVGGWAMLIVLSIVLVTSLIGLKQSMREQTESFNY